MLNLFLLSRPYNSCGLCRPTEKSAKTSTTTANHLKPTPLRLGFYARVLSGKPVHEAIEPIVLVNAVVTLNCTNNHIAAGGNVSVLVNGQYVYQNNVAGSFFIEFNLRKWDMYRYTYSSTTITGTVLKLITE